MEKNKQTNKQALILTYLMQKGYMITGDYWE